jgi:hypothetical protein
MFFPQNLAQPRRLPAPMYEMTGQLTRRDDPGIPCSVGLSASAGLTWHSRRRRARRRRAPRDTTSADRCTAIRRPPHRLGRGRTPRCRPTSARARTGRRRRPRRGSRAPRVIGPGAARDLEVEPTDAYPGVDPRGLDDTRSASDRRPTCDPAGALCGLVQRRAEVVVAHAHARGP